MTSDPIDQMMHSMLWLAGLVAMLALVMTVGNVIIKIMSTPRAVRPSTSADESLSRGAHKALQEEQRATIAERRRAAIARIDAVREDYGTRLSDPAYVIQNHAIDDPAFPQTAEFVDAYAAATAYDLGKLDPDGLEATAGRLERAWRTCWQHAERLGLDALGEHKDTGNRALGLVRTAADPATPETLLPELQRKIGELLVVCQITLPRKAQAALLPSEPHTLPTGQEM